MKFLINILLKFTWMISLGRRLKYRLKKLPFSYKKVGWSFKIYTTQGDTLKKKKWNSIIFISWFNLKTDFVLSGMADPFLITFKNDLHVFFEAINDNKGEIWVAHIKNHRLMEAKCVLKKDYHLSFPNVFFENDEAYMVPESFENNEVGLYKTSRFPDRWEKDTVLFSGKKLVDTTFLKSDGLYFWFTYDLDIKKSRLYYSENLKSNWIEHPKSPFESNRNAGGFIEINNLLLRPVQISKNKYGEGVEMRRIVKLSKKEFEEALYLDSFLTQASGFDLDGSHHITIANHKTKCYIAVDGKNNNFYSIV